MTLGFSVPSSTGERTVPDAGPDPTVDDARSDDARSDDARSDDARSDDAVLDAAAGSAGEGAATAPTAEVPDATPGAAVDPSAPPRRERGVRSRAGNAMERTRAALLDGAVRAVEKYGPRKTTMSDIAMLAGVAKGTLYNHFRAKDAVYAATLESSVRALAEECVGLARDDLAGALALAAERLGTHPALRRVAADEPATLAALLSIGTSTAWTAARSGVRELLLVAGSRSDDATVDVVLRWLTTFVGSPGRGVDTQAALVAAAVAGPAG